MMDTAASGDSATRASDCWDGVDTAASGDVAARTISAGASPTDAAVGGDIASGLALAPGSLVTSIADVAATGDLAVISVQVLGSPIDSAATSDSAPPVTVQAEIEFIGSTLDLATPFNTILVDLPSGVENGDFELLLISTFETPMTPTGWLPVPNGSETTAGGGNASVYYRFANNEPATYTVIGDENAILQVYRGVDPIDPIDASASTLGDSSSAEDPAVTTSLVGDWIVGFFGVDQSPTFVGPSNLVQRELNLFTGNSTTTYAGDTNGPVIIGAEGPYFASQAVDNWVGITIALSPAQQREFVAATDTAGTADSASAIAVPPGIAADSTATGDVASAVAAGTIVSIDAAGTGDSGIATISEEECLQITRRPATRPAQG